MTKAQTSTHTDCRSSRYGRYQATVIARDGNMCMWCSQAVSANLVIQELLPGEGSHKGLNLIGSCASCDESRNGARAVDWLMLSVDKGLSVRWELFGKVLTAVHRKRIDVYNTHDQINTFHMPRFEGESTSCGRRRRIMLRDGNGCVWCSQHLPAYSPKSTVEHLLPVGKGGPSGHHNAVIACDECNNARGSRSVSDWITYCEMLGMSVRYQSIVLALLRVKSRRDEKTSRWAEQQLSLLAPHIRYKYDKDFAAEQDHLQVSAETAFELAYAG